MQRTDDIFPNTKNVSTSRHLTDSTGRNSRCGWWTNIANCWKSPEFRRGHLLSACLLYFFFFFFGKKNFIIQYNAHQSSFRFLTKIIYPLTVARRSAADLFQTSLMAGRQILLRGWTSPREPSFREWLIQQGKVASAEQVSFRMRNRTDQYISRWGHFSDVHL